jgi:hypothetical protein
MGLEIETRYRQEQCAKGTFIVKQDVRK